MLVFYFLAKPVFWILPWIIQAAAYFKILSKMGLNKYTGIVPFIGEWEMSKALFRKMRSFFRPFIIAVILVLAAFYLGPYSGMGRGFMIVAFIIYGIFLIRLYWRLAKSFGKGKFFGFMTAFVPLIFLPILGFGKSEYTAPVFKPEKERSKGMRIFRRVVFIVVSVVEVLVIVLGVGFLAIRTTPPTFMVDSILKETYEKTSNIKGTGIVMTREDALGKNAKIVDELEHSRDYFFPDHSNDKNVVVLAYVVGSNLEDRMGLASANIQQMMDATKQGDGLKFVIEAGGSKRWFTSGIKDSSYGRYEIADGKISMVEELPEDTSMSESKNLADFLTWAKKNYEADRYMLVLWDHGGGVAFGYGQDDVNQIKDGTMSVSQLVSAIKKSGMKFDVIGFDACLMQDIEIATALEPYADYYLASEETEGGFGWFYTSAFGKLAKNPGLSSEKFGREIVACYDPYNTIIKNDDGLVDSKATLSFVDLTLAKPAYEKLATFLSEASAVIKNNPAGYADLAVAADNAYTFEQKLQIDLLDFLKILNKLDYDETICSHSEKAELIQAIQASILYRNGNSAKGIYGMSVALPYKNIGFYGSTHDELDKLSLDTEKQTFDEIFSIMAAQQQKQSSDDKKAKKREADSFEEMLMEMLGDTDYTKEDWYIAGFENYDNTQAFVDIPLTDTPNGCRVELPDNAWDIISDCQTMAYQALDENSDPKPEGAVRRYIGKDHIGEDDENGHPLIGMDEFWVHVGDELVCYEDQPVRETDEGLIFTGTIKARLNDEEDITLNVEWDPVKKGSEEPYVGHITGYVDDGLLSFLNDKGSKDLKAGDTIQFLFDYYDANGKLVATKPAGNKIRVTKQSRLEVHDKELPEGSTIEYCGVLTDIYQRVMTTEQVEMQF